MGSFLLASRFLRLRIHVVLLAAATAACGGQTASPGKATPPDLDAGPSSDAAPGLDAGPSSDAAPGLDAGPGLDAAPKSDAGDAAPSDAGTWSPGVVAASYNAAVVGNARQLCNEIDILSWSDANTAYTPADIQSHLVGAWLMCDYSDLRDASSYEFTADGHWATLQPDGSNGLGIAPSAEDGGAGSQGTYTLTDANGNAAGPTGPVVDIASGASAWFHPEFRLGPRRMVAYFTDGSSTFFVQIGQ